ncbi:putative 3-demethylubiquinone-9 3-methyltransferase (glyoxalase superfamily) [Branchiibius hedensis]|uniref:Glyoxalase superfamily enzyme, possibly 3-demethylubiquinone-9 3-methyltransferase n=1 Tax=Branchiibius hedensis TaxID=672460 RepID=A0A2Y9BU44_9MICO|nr:VOC family protein [Branchiibius hedensis]PWJ26300.1 putative 3-demethylubiquinone-9 3-methyltransferase (glyoxalase superfamily) [Branchiibius hedensis]SSA35112.1 Glyoxalase superfamily enzyme, possibly 3-demethylubiquinone-9 3-methyltransferase [Branchiibius hedensis]
MPKIVPCIWFDNDAVGAAELYVSLFPDSRIVRTTDYPGSTDEGLADFQLDRAGRVLTVDFELAGLSFVGLNAGPQFKPTPALSFMVNFDPSRDPDARASLDRVWAALGDGGQVLMQLGEYPFSPHYGWVNDKYGVSWQLILTNPEGDPRPHIMPSFLFSGAVTGKAQEAIAHWGSLFEGSHPGQIVTRPEAEGSAAAGSLLFGDFTLGDQWFVAMDSPVEHAFGFTEGVSLMVDAHGQEGIDHFWAGLSHVPEAEQCGWCKDEYGVSWQVIPDNFEQLMSRPDAFATMMNQHKIVIDEY